jgi:AraC-like DNA-binding protein
MIIVPTADISGTPRPQIAVFQPDSTASARLRDALSADYDLQAVGTWSELSMRVRTARMSACIVDIYGPASTIPPDRVGRLRKRQPDLAIVVYSDFSKNRLDPFELGRRGVDAVIDAGADDPAAIRDAVSRSYASATAGAVASDLAGRVPDLLVEALQWAVESASGKPRAGDLAAALGMSRAELARELGCLNAPPARVLLVWGRVLHAARLLEWGKTVESSAHESGYANGSALHRAFSRRVGFPPGNVPDRGGLAPTLSALLASVRIKNFR